jgi:hypothetical protein
VFHSPVIRIFRIGHAQEERYLAGVDGMNAFAAAAILSQISLHDFLALRADHRLELLLPIPQDMMVGRVLFLFGV